MFGFLAALGPVGITTAAIGTIGYAIYNYVKEDENESLDIEQNVAINHHDKKNNLIKQKIKNYKQMQKKKIKKQYGIDIEFVSESSKIASSSLGMMYVNIDSFTMDYKTKVSIDDEIQKKDLLIKNSEKEIAELNKLLRELKELRNE